MMRYIECPAELPTPWSHRKATTPGYESRLPVDPDKTTDILFLAGGITGCPDWQTEMTDAMKDLSDLTILNPRRANLDVVNPRLAEEQILWESRHLKMANIISFWFPAETVCPIALYELGMWTDKAPLLFVGTDAAYSRRQDVIIQTRLRKREQPIYYRLDQMIEAMRDILTLDY